MKVIAFAIKTFVLLASFAGLALAMKAKPSVSVTKEYPSALGERIAQEAERLDLVDGTVPKRFHIYEFADFECPACRSARDPIREIVSSGAAS